ncbi:MAG: hypothetical protein ACOYMA_02240 [Bacteroidia bacterium]
MEYKDKILLKISWYIGLIAFVGGWSIFIIWTIGRYAFALDLKKLEGIGFFWTVSFFWLSLIALSLLISYVISNRNNLHLKMLFTVIVILINIPSVLIILLLQGKIQNKVFVKLINQSSLEKIEFKLQGKLTTWNFGSIEKGSSKVFNYDPPYWNNDARLYQKPDTLNLIITHDGTKDTIGFPTLRMGDCKQMILDKNLKINIQ